MIAVVRVRWNNTPPANVWTDAVMNEWMNPNTPFSLAHYWTRTSLFQADLRFYLFPPIAIDDPRAKTPVGGNSRQDLVDGALAEVTRLFSPDWNLFERAVLVFAQQTDLFGGGSYIVPVGDGTKSIPAAICDIASSFDQIVQEVGHAFGLDHEVDGLGREYQSPYSSMSSELYGSTNPTFKRPEDSRLPVGVGVDNPPSDCQRTIGPYITPVQFYISKSMPSFKDSGTVYQFLHRILHHPTRFDLRPSMRQSIAGRFESRCWLFFRRPPAAAIPTLWSCDDRAATMQVSLTTELTAHPWL